MPVFFRVCFGCVDDLGYLVDGPARHAGKLPDLVEGFSRWRYIVQSLHNVIPRALSPFRSLFFGRLHRPPDRVYFSREKILPNFVFPASPCPTRQRKITQFLSSLNRSFPKQLPFAFHAGSRG
jgi:hypothetical protein